ncbi:Pro-Pol polyprotein [Labeo rohita]|uniref:ribonuclease H n=1 Tax=Labeo rohita TaxID=84645 RepID=A0ABQ8LDX6_LABRO|nr:Pro-Pol polyprotein [Labeo rohita]
MSEIEIEDYSSDFQDPAALPASVQAADQAASQATSAPQDPPIEPTAASRGRRPSRDAAARTSRRRTTPSPPPSRRPPPSPASSYASALSSAPAKAKWTVVGLRQALASSGVIIPRRSTKADLLTLYASLQVGENPGSAPPYARPEQTTTPPRTASRPSGRSEGPSASRGHPPKAAVASHCLLPDHPSGSSLLMPAESRSSPPQAAIAARARPPRQKNPARSFCPAVLIGGLWTPSSITECSWAAATSPAQSAVLFPTPPSHALSSIHPFLPAPNHPNPNPLAMSRASWIPQPPPLPHFAAAHLPSSARSAPALTAAELLHHPDSLFTDYVLSGFAHGFHPGVVSLPSQSLICRNLHSALTEPEIVDLLVKKEIDANFMIGPYAIPPFPIFRVSPIGVATRKFSGKKRLIIDLSSPHNSPFPSINSLIPLEEFSLHYHDVDQAITLIKDAGRGVWLAKVDITSAFKVMPIHPDFWHLFGIRWKNEFYFAVRLTFGCRSSPKIFDTLSEAICWILSNNYNIPYLIHLLDDFLIVSPPDSVPAAHLLTIQKLFSELGIPLAQDKTEGPSTSIEFLGINLDSQKFLASLPKEKIDRTIMIASTLLTNTSCSKRELLSILGHLNFAMRIIPQGRPFISHLLSLASSAHALEDRISITDSCRNELSLWISFLKQWNGLSFFYSNLVSSPIDIQLYTDAAPSVGFGGFLRGHWFTSTWPPELADLPQQLSSSALFELYLLVAAASLWGKEWSATSIVVHCDNEAIMHCINKEIQIAGTRGRPAPDPGSSLFRTDIPVNHPLRPLLEASINSILQAVSPRTLQSYLTTWKCFKVFHSAYSLPFPDFSLLAVTSFISHLNTNKNLQASSIKGYLSGIQFFHKLLYGSPSPHLTNSQTSLLIKGYHSIHTARTLDAMFILAFFGFLRCSELAITSGFNPAIHPTISDLAVLDGETISYFIKQTFLQLRKSQSKLPSDPLFTDDFNRPATRFWFQKHLKSILLLSGTPADNFSSHSFRIGAATTAAQKGLSQQQIQALGRWSSEAFKSYIRSDRSLIKEAHQTLIIHSNPFSSPSNNIISPLRPSPQHPTPVGASRCFPTLPQQCPLPLEPPLLFSLLPQQCPLPQELYSQSPSAAFSIFFPSSACKSSSRIFPFLHYDYVQHPFSPSQAFFWGLFSIPPPPRLLTFSPGERLLGSGQMPSSYPSP